MPVSTFAAGNEYTIRNLLASYQGEINAQARYKAFAIRADADGLYGIGSLFRATARAEQIHANNQARVIRKMRGEAAAEVYAYKVRNTLENLKVALSGENYEISTMYPTFIEEATAHINSSAARSFIWALEAEKTHARLFSEAVVLLGHEQNTTWIGSVRTFYLCPVCAFTSETSSADNCSTCFYPSDRLEIIR